MCIPWSVHLPSWFATFPQLQPTEQVRLQPEQVSKMFSVLEDVIHTKFTYLQCQEYSTCPGIVHLSSEDNSHNSGAAVDRLWSDRRQEQPFEYGRREEFKFLGVRPTGKFRYIIATAQCYSVTISILRHDTIFSRLNFSLNLNHYTEVIKLASPCYLKRCRDHRGSRTNWILILK